MLARLHVPLSWGELLKRTIKETTADDVFSLAAQQAYYFLFALFPALLALISIASYFPIEGLVDEVVSRLGGVAPPDVIRIINEQLIEIGRSRTGGVLTVAFPFTLWSSSSAMLSMTTTLNAAYLAFAGDYNETYGAIGGVMVLLLWFYLSGLTILMGAELNSEIEHASPFGKDVGEKVPGGRKKIGAAAEREHEAPKARGELTLGSLREDVNCDLDPAVPPGSRDEPGVRPSELLIGAAALLPVALKIGRDVRKKVGGPDRDRDDRAA
jgi:uncharacterized BrkB/YihY/UPF0761 family membrane protein